ncbi:Hpt domain-containing protein [Pseudoflavonifractor sp. BIOML-A6]|jgi:putative hpt domain protein|nr:Hpt domain-containing protein [Pseudoflavonifractor sp. BIOML-A16]MTR05666.1 Hpt domain-containing protein [Pseudoflavonifractor sp. BIOML-A15]MTR14557.1 Hpt domain-containing protein [Pseudoflavonifractor sp. BIOML-A17]MTR20052.1 Hpt domain-containing protein [Pseudoflavonifractor sp. BIOML-A19]MTR32053.1 Hpt domain-containing protein [Pseudoflavonifractor sp. BIOML-A14]MTR35007.1 Hpt domain-containing protein [Pseudoflavonifractor sp. BIOML-A9]MTR44721.1 Hpt domain-containing protein [Ps
MYQYIMIKGDGPVNLRECYAAAAADYDDVMRRFMSENRVDRFLTMFLRDGSFELLCSAMDAGDYQDAFRAVHTIKGISMNLSLNALRDACIELTENLRAGTPDDRTQPCFDRVREEYHRTRAAIRSHLN